MALSLQYTGARPYTELKLSGVVYGFGRGAIRSDIPEDFITSKIIPMISNGATSWVVINDAKEIKTTEKSIATANTSTKASMTDLAREYVAGLN